jgi:hypothetical protein
MHGRPTVGGGSREVDAGKTWSGLVQRAFHRIVGASDCRETTVAADEAIVRLRLGNRGDEEKLELRQTSNGWKVLAPSAAVDHLKKSCRLPSRARGRVQFSIAKNFVRPARDLVASHENTEH